MERRNSDSRFVLCWTDSHRFHTIGVSCGGEASINTAHVFSQRRKDAQMWIVWMYGCTFGRMKECGVERGGKKNETMTETWEGKSEVNRKRVSVPRRLSTFHQASAPMQACRRVAGKRNTLCYFLVIKCSSGVSLGRKNGWLPRHTNTRRPHARSKSTVRMSEAAEWRTGAILERVVSALKQQGWKPSTPSFSFSPTSFLSEAIVHYFFLYSL